MNSIILYLQQTPVALQTVAVLFGLIVGSFLNVVIYRYPIMLKREWKQMSLEYLASENPSSNNFALDGDDDDEKITQANQNNSIEEPFNLAVPASACPTCHHKIQPWENIPIISYLFLLGKCSNCKTSISPRYPFVELLTAMVFYLATLHSAPNLHLIFLLFFCVFLIILSGIDIDHQILPDPMVYILLWSGLLASTLGISIPIKDAVIGALAGYLSLWSIFWIFKLLTKKEGMGYGDFKLLAALGAWLGWQYLLPIILIASLGGAIIGGFSMLVFKSGNKIPFGPYLAIAGWIMMFWGDNIIHSYLRWSGIA